MRIFASCGVKRVCSQFVVFLLVFIHVSASLSADKAMNVDALFNLPLNELMQTEVVSVSKRAQPLSDVAAATYVITQERIRRSGLNSIPELLRMVPGLNVAQLDANKWAISARGFNRLYARNLLVMIDGRSVYSPLFAGVHWDAIDIALEDIERIEVIRGPGAALWGANAVNGVINIITKRSGATQGQMLSVELGDEDNILTARHGGKLNHGGHYRVYLKARDVDDFVDASEQDTADNWEAYTLGFRSDWMLSVQDTVSVHGDYYIGNLGATLSYTDLNNAPSYRTTEVNDTEAVSANLMMRWARSYSSTSEVVWQVYYDNIVREELPFRERHDTYDIDMQHRFAFTPEQTLTWGINYRTTRQETNKSFRFSFDNDKETISQGGLFLQDEVLALDERLAVTVGAKVEYFEYSGLEFQPNLRMAWRLEDGQTFWASTARAVRSPARTDTDARINILAFQSPSCANGNLCLVRLTGNESIESETVHAYEFGFRGQVNKQVSYDASMYYNEYKDMISSQSGPRYAVTDEAPLHEVLIRQFVNGASGHTKGFEFSSTIQVLPSWRMLVGMTFLDMNITASDGYDVNGESPEQQYQLHNYFNLTNHLELDFLIYYVDEVDVQYRSQTIDAYVRADVRLGWQVSPEGEVSLGVRNLADDRHAEIGDIPYTIGSEVERSSYLKWTHNF